jgi:integrase
MAKTILQVEPGLYRRLTKTGAWGEHLWFTTVVDGQTVFRSTKTTNLREARKIRALAVAASESGTPQPKARLLVSELLDRLVAYHEKNASPSLRTVRGHVEALKATLGTKRARDLRTKHIDAMQLAWQREGTVSDVTINKRCQSLRRALNLAKEAGDLVVVPHVPFIKTKSRRGLYIRGGDHALLAEHLPDYVVLLLDFARLYGIRKGQLSRTWVDWVNLERRLIEWPGEECKNDEPHVVPLDDAAMAQVERLLAICATHPWCPYLFHGPYCSPHRKPSKVYGCVGDFKKAWATACQAAGLPVGRKNGGYTFHHTRNTAVTDMLASGMLSTAEAMAISAHKTESMIKHYNLGNIEALRERLERSRQETSRLQDASDAARPLHSVAPAGLK